MTQTVRIHRAEVKDKLGWGRPNAFISIWDVTEEIKSRSTSSDGISDYVEESHSHVIEYKGNYWGDRQMQIDGLDSRPLAHFVEVDSEVVYETNEYNENTLDDAGGKIPTGEIKPAYMVWTDKFYVDMKHPESIQITSNDSISGKEERNRLIELDVKRKFPASAVS